MFSWGSSKCQELHIEDNLESVVKLPTSSKWELAKNIVSIAAGDSHSLYLTSEGNIYTCGSNEAGQLGRESNSNWSQPDLVETFKGCFITALACGNQHSIALDEWGQPFSWGSDNMGQLGTNMGQLFQIKPKIIKTLATKNVIQIACGLHHSVALTNSGDLFAWGANNFGQLGLGKVTPKEQIPQQVMSLAGIPIALIVCGGEHTFALSKSGAVFGWGRNGFGQLGLQDTEDRCYPTHLKSLRSVRICYISCGENFSAFLTLDGGVFTCGSGENGQTGHGSIRDELSPRKVMELMGSTVCQIACGRNHMLCTVGNRIMSCGDDRNGQLGLAAFTNVLVPTPINLPSSTDEGQSSSPSPTGSVQIFAGGDHSFCTVNSMERPPVDYRQTDPKKQTLSLSIPKLSACQMFKDGDRVNQDLMAYLETVFASLACINGSFLLENNAHYNCNTRSPGVDMRKAEEGFTLLSRIENSSIKELIFNNITQQLLTGFKSSPPDTEVLRLFLIVPYYHEMRNPRRHPELQGPFAEALNNLQPVPAKIVCMWWSLQSAEYFEMLVDIFKSVIVYELMQQTVATSKKINFSHSLKQILDALAFLNKINFANQNSPKLRAEVFYVENLCNYIDITRDYIDWLSDSDGRTIHMCNYPFLFDVQCKSTLLRIDQRLQMHLAISRAAQAILTRIVLEPNYVGYSQQQFFHLTVSRTSIVQDTMNQIANHDSSQLKKPLRVEFIGEEAEDAGGVRKEFFFLLLNAIFDPVYGMFKQFDDTRMIWFSTNPFEDDIMYYLIGAIYGLAIYNSIIIYVPFPLALYKKILGEPVMLDDLLDLNPILANNLKKLVEYEGEDVEDVFGLVFAVNTEAFDQMQSNPLKENGENISVTHLNKQEYVDLYVDFLLNKSVERQFRAFNQGFQKVCGGRIIKLFQSHELMSVVIGNEEYDWEAFESSAEYKNGYNSNDNQIRWFWEVFHELSVEDKKKFLLFLTGSDRVPIQGMKEIKIFIQPSADERFFPVAHTCFNLLDLPRYGTKERLRYHLLLAIQQTQGFSLV